MTAWRNLPSALPPHGTVLAWARGCRCEECEREYQRFVSELALRGALRLGGPPEPRWPPPATISGAEPVVPPGPWRRLMLNAEGPRDRGSKDGRSRAPAKA